MAKQVLEGAAPVASGADGKIIALKDVFSRAVERLRPQSGDLALMIGLACYFAWVDCMFYSSKLVFCCAPTFPRREDIDIIYYASIIVLLAVFALCALRHRQATRYLLGAPALVIAPVGMALSSLGYLAVSAPGIMGISIAVLCGVVSGVASAVAILQWGALSTTFSLRRNVWIGSFGYALSQFLCFIFLVMAKVTSAMPVAEGIILVVLLVLMAVVSGYVVRLQFKDVDVDVIAQSNASDDGGHADPSAEHLSHRIPLRICAALLIIGFVPFACRDLTTTYADPMQGTGSVFIIFGQIALAVTLIAVALVLCLLSRDPQRSGGILYRVLVGISLAGVCLLPAIAVFHQSFIGAVTLLTSASLTSLHIVMWIATVMLCRAFPSRSILYFSCMRFFWALGPLLGNIYCMMITPDGAGLEHLYLTMCLCVVLVFVLYSCCFNEKTLAESLSLLPCKYRRPYKERCAQISARFGLTERESEIMAQFGKGRDAAFIQQYYQLSRSTVSTHRQHIYMKLGIHSLQELLDMLYDLESASESK